MPKPYKRSSFGKSGRPSFGARRPNYGQSRGASFGGDRPELCDAVCSECGQDCKVPFKPNGKKPVFCNNCFKRDDGPREMGPRREAPRRERGSFRGNDERPDRRNDAIEQQLRSINEKLDALINALSE